MNCCDDFGDCNQGRNCPVRVAKIGRRDYTHEALPPSTWRQTVKAIAYWMLLGILGWLIFAMMLAGIVYFR